MTCIETASCEEGDHTYSWPCDLAPMGEEAAEDGPAGPWVDVPRVHLEEWARLLGVFAADDHLGRNARDQMAAVAEQIHYWSLDHATASA